MHAPCVHGANVCTGCRWVDTDHSCISVYFYIWCKRMVTANASVSAWDEIRIFTILNVFYTMYYFRSKINLLLLLLVVLIYYMLATSTVISWKEEMPIKSHFVILFQKTNSELRPPSLNYGRSYFRSSSKRSIFQILLHLYNNENLTSKTIPRFSNMVTILARFIL